MFNYNEFFITNFLFFYIKKKVTLYEKISFSNYMYLYLYTYRFGYYENELIKFGNRGDYVTAPTIGNIFAMCVSRQIQKIKPFVRNCFIVEYGPGTGSLSVKIIKELSRLKVVFFCYVIVEKSSYLRYQQKKLLQNFIKKYNIVWVTKINKKINGIFILNEILDALPVECFFYENGFIFEYFVKYVSNSFTFIKNEINNTLKKLVNYKKKFFTVDVYKSEVNLNIYYMLSLLYTYTSLGYFMFFDYGYLDNIYYSNDRSTGTMVCYHKHQTNIDFFVRYGLQDITAHIDFSYTMRSILSIGFYVLEYTTLSKFIYNCDLLNIIIILNQAKGINLSLAQELNFLFSPTNMGEVFKVLFVGKGLKLNLL